MTSEQIDLLTRLQPFLREKMGEYIWGDKVFKDGDCGFVVHADKYSVNILWKEANYNSDYALDNNFLRVPLASDPDNPEMGLIKMLKNFLGLWPENGLFLVNNGGLIVKVDDEYTALLKALVEQVNV